MPQRPLLVPMPQQIELRTGNFSLPEQPIIYMATADEQTIGVATMLARALKPVGLAPDLTVAAAPGAVITLRQNVNLLPRPQSYRLVVDESGVNITAGDAAGLYYGMHTLLQLLLPLHPEHGVTLALPHLRINDWPDFPHRGVLLDIARDKVPTLETLFDLVERLARLKINQLQLYTEHTFAYRGHEEVWRNSGALTGEEIIALDAHCRKHFVELVPNQNSFGHMHRWLKHDRYRPMAEVPEGWVHPFGPDREPYGLAPGKPESLAFLADLYDQLLPHFSSRQFNACLDETFDLGMGQSKALCAEKGVGRVYLDFVQQIADLVRRHGRTLQFWGDIIMHYPHLIAELPKDAILLEWGYEKDHPFAEHGMKFAEAGLSFYVCPGTSSWNSLAGRTDNAIANLRNAAVSGKEHGAIGYLNTDWGDFGHLQPLSVSYLGYMLGAAYSWNVTSAQSETALDIPALLDRHVFHDSAGIMGQSVYALGNTYRETGQTPVNSSLLFWQFLLPILDKEAIDQEMIGWNLERINELEQMSLNADFDVFREHIDDVMDKMQHAKMACADASVIEAEFQWVANMLRFAATLGLLRSQQGSYVSVRQLPQAQRVILADDLRALIARHAEVWQMRNKAGGMEDSARALRTVLSMLEA